MPGTNEVVDDFEAAFNDLVAGKLETPGDGGDLGEVDNTDHKPDDEPGEEKPGEEKPGEEKPGEEKPGEEKPGEEKPGEEKPGVGAEETEEQKRAREAAERNEAENKRLEDEAKAEEEARQKQEEEARTAAEKAAETASAGLAPSQEEEALLAKFKEEWPDHFPAIEALLNIQRRQSEARYSKALETVARRIYDDIRPVAETAAATANKGHFETIKAAHADFDKIKADLAPWIAKQPPYLAKAMKEVYTAGNAEEVIDLVQRYKDTNGIVSPKSGADSSSNEKKPAASKQKLDAMESVDSKRSTPRETGVDSNDFDSAFDEAVKALGNGR